ncbi:T9SS type A sorting domain-containing protein [Flavobacterium sp.]|uniref:T9SS type A sorting domain-containing protein n=1 Tax=Flavobacterium sp. TaxID=239 RepID=UPI0022BE92B3|nr:T9SS type A sorting domain-containing protein [Flavobacterium sp.]MCZ8170009.1 T9SS type A sorting domain-containing protein [Flavobacterium sp.]MCZ8297112.1 T9SS type A sorting domain-containing protein [Flavobacterium sp.]
MKSMLFTLLFFTLGFSQQQDNQRFLFAYDTAGNQINSIRTVNINTTNRVAENHVYDKFYNQDEFSYYPNPTKEMLFLKWENKNDMPIKLSIFDVNGKLIQDLEIFQSEMEMTISFAEMPVGVYILEMSYKNSDSKSIKIIKN